MLQVLTTPVQPDFHSHVCIHITLPSLVLKSLSWKYAVDWGSLIMLCCVCALQQILMSVQPGKTTAQRTRCASTHMAVSSVSVLTAPKSQTLHTSRHHPCKHRPQSSFYIHVFISVAFDLRCTALRKWGHSAIFLKKKKCLDSFQPSFPLFFALRRRCERNPCPLDNKACSQTPNSFSYHYLAVVSNLSAPRVMFRVSALRPIGDTLRFSLLGGRLARRHFTVQRSDRVTGQLMLVSPAQGPATLEAEVEMSELERRVQIGRYITKVTMFVSQYEF